MRKLLLLLAPLSGFLRAQDALTVPQAVAAALQNHPSVQASAEAVKAASARVSEARGAQLPHVDYTESWQRSNNQVFVFGSLLEQQQFAAQNFELGALNQPPFLNNFQSQVMAEQNVFDSGLRRERVTLAQLRKEVARTQSRRTEIDVIEDVLRAYYAAVLSKENARVAAEAVRFAQADLDRAETRLGAGIATDADVLSIRVYLGGMRERQVRADADVKLAAAVLNQAMGVPLDARYDLTTRLEETAPASGDAAGAESDAIANRPELRAASLAVGMNQSQAKAARTALFPEFFVRGGVEADRQRFVTRGGANWMVGAGMRWNLFNGFSTRAQQQAAQHEVLRSQSQQRQVESATQLAARRAWLELASAGQRIEVTRSTVAMAQESLRIIRNRYDAGLTTVTELLRGETALLEAQTGELQAVRDQRMAAVMVEAARGKLTKDSDVVTR